MLKILAKKIEKENDKRVRNVGIRVRNFDIETVWVVVVVVSSAVVVLVLENLNGNVKVEAVLRTKARIIVVGVVHEVRFKIVWVGFLSLDSNLVVIDFKIRSKKYESI